jgi:hypothetical protein
MHLHRDTGARSCCSSAWQLRQRVGVGDDGVGVGRGRQRAAPCSLSSSSTRSTPSPSPRPARLAADLLDQVVVAPAAADRALRAQLSVMNSNTVWL